MKRSFDITRALILAAMLGLMVVAGLAMRAQITDSQNLKGADQENLYWNIAQVEIELARFVSSLAAFKFGAGEVDAVEVNRRFNVLWSRVDIFRSGKLGARMRALDTGGRIPDFQKLLESYDRQITTIDEQPSGVVFQAISDFQGKGRALRDLTGIVVRAEEARFADVRSQLRESGTLSLLTSIGAIALAVLLVGIMLYETRRYRLQAEESHALAMAAEAAARSKSRFLTMMSHELRTPMNGVLGMLELVRQTPMTDRQQRLVEQAKRSGGQMVALIEDILDLSDLEEEGERLDAEAFRPADLVQQIETALEAEIQKGGLSLSVMTAPDLPAQVMGDPVRLQKIIRYMTQALVEFVGAKALDISIGHVPDRLRVEIETQARDQNQPGWRPQDLLERGEEGYGSFASDSLGPLIARGLAAVIGGEIRSEDREDARIAFVIEVPVARAGAAAPLVRLAVETATLEMILRGMARRGEWRLWEGGSDAETVDVVLAEVGAATAVPASLRQLHPAARLVALGQPEDAQAYDGSCRLPPSPDALARAMAGPRKINLKAVS